MEQFFKSEAAMFIFAILHLEGEARLNLLGLNDKKYFVSPQLCEKRFKEIEKEIWLCNTIEEDVKQAAVQKLELDVFEATFC